MCTCQSKNKVAVSQGDFNIQKDLVMEGSPVLEKGQGRSGQ